MHSFGQDVRYALRMLLKTPVVTTVAALSLALGMAANASMFAILNAWFVEALPYAEQDRLVVLHELREGQGIEEASGVSIPDYRDFVEASTTFEAATVYTVDNANMTGMDVPERLRIVTATPGLFQVFGVQPSIGRGFSSEEGAQGRGNVIVLNHAFWEARFSADPGAVGRTIALDGVPHTIVGVMPESFDMIPADVEGMRPSDFEDRMEARAGRGYIALARLRPGATVERAELELQSVAARLASEFPETNRGWELQLQPLRQWFPGPTDTKLMMVLTAVTFFGLLIACANVANLLLGRAERRHHEVAVRTALGAGRMRILRQLITESVALGALGGAVGVVMSIWVVRWIRAAMPTMMPRSLMPELDPEVVVVTLLLAVGAGVLFGLAPALTAVRPDVTRALGGARGGTAGRSRKRLRNLFVVAEFAVALALLTGAGFLVDVFGELSDAEPGFRPDGLLTLELSVLEDRYPDDEQVVAYGQELVQAMASVPGVESVAVMSTLPRSRSNPRARYTVDGRPALEPTERPAAGVQIVNPEYFVAMEIPLRSGRLFDSSDREDAAAVAVISRAFVDREFPEEDPLGRSITVSDESRTIVGVVENIVQDRISVRGRRGEAIYLPTTQNALRNPSFALRTATSSSSELGADVRRAIWAVQPDQPIASLRPFADHQAESLAGPRAMSTFLMAMAGIALLLAAMGIYGVMSHAVVQQRREIGIRMALGAQRWTVLGMVTRSGLGLAGVGMLIGLPLAFLMYRGVQSTLNLFEADLGYGFAAWVALSLAVAATVSVLLPAARASGVAPASALREE